MTAARVFAALSIATALGCVGTVEGVPLPDPPLREPPSLQDSTALVFGPAAATVDATDPPPVVDPPPTTTPLDCAAATGLLFCEDFEDGRIDPARFEADTSGGGTVSVEETAAHEGRYGARMHLPSGDGVRGALRNEALFPIEGNRFFGRVFVRVAGPLPETHSFLIEAAGRLDGALTRYRLDSNGGTLNSRYTHPAILEHGGWRKMGVDMPRDTWTCIEWEYDGALGEMRYFIDGTLIDDMTVTAAEDPPWLPPTFESLVLGWHTFQAAPVTDVYYDSIAISLERIGC